MLPIELKNGKSVNLVVAAINHYEENQVIFAFDNLVNKHNMNEEDSNTGGWRNCKMREHLSYELIELLPDELKAVISARTIVQRIDGKNYLSTDKLWLPSATEVGERCAADIDDKPFPIFSGERSRIREFNGETSWWWLRSPNVYYTTYFCYVFTTTVTSPTTTRPMRMAFAPVLLSKNISTNIWRLCPPERRY